MCSYDMEPCRQDTERADGPAASLRPTLTVLLAAGRSLSSHEKRLEPPALLINTQSPPESHTRGGCLSPPPPIHSHSLTPAWHLVSVLKLSVSSVCLLLFFIYFYVLPQSLFNSFHLLFVLFFSQTFSFPRGHSPPSLTRCRSRPSLSDSVSLAPSLSDSVSLAPPSLSLGPCVVPSVPRLFFCPSVR